METAMLNGAIQWRKAMQARMKIYSEVEGPIVVRLDAVTIQESSGRIQTLVLSQAKAKCAIFLPNDCLERLDIHWICRKMLGCNQQVKCPSPRCEENMRFQAQQNGRLALDVRLPAGRNRENCQEMSLRSVNTPVLGTHWVCCSACLGNVCETGSTPLLPKTRLPGRSLQGSKFSKLIWSHKRHKDMELDSQCVF